ncbi:hypothetical protein G7Z17_g11844 [Cylindrodendrum hubeiense]|uniref:Ankyrin repeat protein n=1 Tax=Cylindrodendrum hubeiense TaxID=595255 RepID=A0A9P5H219_9HYPO|nr:hypothetical protein G7Z17_g11844 [Cylindrodendrum hubeiense]
MELVQKIKTLDAHTVEATDEDHERAIELMLQYRTESRRRASSTFGIKDANAALERVVQGSVSNATTGLVQALLDNGADVRIARRRSTNLFKIIMRKNQVDIPSNALEQATRNCSDEVVYLLAQNSDERGTTEALPVAINRNDSLKVHILLASGADASRACDEFLRAVDSGSDDIVNILLRNFKGACQDCRNRGLVSAANHGHAAKAQMLMANGAKVNFENGAALLTACRSRNEDVAMDIASHQEMKHHPALLDKAVAEAYDHMQYQLIEACLRAGAKGPMTDATLLKALEAQNLYLVESLIQHGASVTDGNGAAVVSAVKAGQPDLLRLVLQGKPAGTMLGAAIIESVQLADLNIVYEMVDLLLSADLRGDSVSATLVQVLDRTLMTGEEISHRSLIELLLTKGQADVNFEGGRPLTVAISKRRIDILSLLLQRQTTVDSLSAAVTSAMSLNVPHLRFEAVKMVIEAGSTYSALEIAHDDRVKRAATTAAAKFLLLDMLQYLTKFNISRAIFSAAVAAAASEGELWLSPSGLEVMDFLLESGASGPEVDDAFCLATKRFNQDAIELLSDSVSPLGLQRSLRSVIEHSEDWQSSKNLWLIGHLLERGCSGEPVNIALLQAANTYANGTDTGALDILLPEEGTADVNFRNGEALKIAIRSGHAPLLERFISSGASREAMTEAFATIITVPLEEDKVLALIDVLVNFSKGTEAGCDFKAILQDGRPPIAACILAHPKSSKLVERLIQLGCDLETKFPATIYAQEQIGEEQVTTLLWALHSHTNLVITSAVINALIDAKANVKFVAPVSKATPLILAAKYGRMDIVKKLIAEKAEPRIRDRFDKAPLFYASQAGDLASVKELIKANSRINDGSLHEAARNLHSKVVGALIKGNHDPSFHSSKQEHDGRSALQELAARCDGTQDPIELEETILALEKGNGNALTKHRQSGKNALFLAFGNSQPYPVTNALLNTIMWRNINDEENVFVKLHTETGDEYHYSPTMYLEKYYKGDGPERAHGAELLKLLRDKQCQDRFYVKFGPGGIRSRQPPGAIGMPEKIAEDETRRRKEEEKRLTKKFEFEEKIHQELEEARIKAEIEARRHEQKLNHSSMTHQNQLIQHGQLTQQQIVAQQQKLELTAAAQDRAEQAKGRAAQLSVAKTQNEQKQKIQFEQQQAEQALSLQQEKNKLAKKAADEKLAAEKKVGREKLSIQQEKDKLARRAASDKLAAERKVGKEKLSVQQEKDRLARKAASDKLAAERRKLELKERGY